MLMKEKVKGIRAMDVLHRELIQIFEATCSRYRQRPVHLLGKLS